MTHETNSKLLGIFFMFHVLTLLLVAGDICVYISNHKS